MGWLRKFWLNFFHFSRLDMHGVYIYIYISHTALSTRPTRMTCMRRAECHVRRKLRYSARAGNLAARTRDLAKMAG